MKSGALDPSVTAELAARFRPRDLSAAQALLEGTALPLIDNLASFQAARVHLAVIRLANGNLEKLSKEISLASSDWRDVLVAAGLADADWQLVLAKEGFRVPRCPPDP